MSKGNEPIHPVETWQESPDAPVTLHPRMSPGISKREYFAAMAMQGMLANANKAAHDKLGGTPRNIADWAIDYADALLEAFAADAEAVR